MLNPYIHRKMIRDPEKFYGRREEVDFVYQSIASSEPQSISIIGPRRIGKSSILGCLEHPAMQERFNVSDYFNRSVFIYLDLLTASAITPEKFFATILRKINLIKGFDLIGSDTAISPDDFEYKIEHLLRNNLDKIIILLDEFDKITANTQFDEGFFSTFRALCNRLNMALVTASHKPLHELCHSDDVRSSPFFNIFKTRILPLMSEDEAMQMVTYPAGKLGLDMDGAVDWVMQIAGRHPFYLNMVATYVFPIIKDGGKLDEEAKAKIISQVLLESTGILKHALDGLSEEELDYLKRVQSNQLADRDFKMEEHLSGFSFLDMSLGVPRLSNQVLGLFLVDYIRAPQTDLQSEADSDSAIDLPTTPLETTYTDTFEKPDEPDGENSKTEIPLPEMKLPDQPLIESEKEASSSELSDAKPAEITLPVSPAKSDRVMKVTLRDGSVLPLKIKVKELKIQTSAGDVITIKSSQIQSMDYTGSPSFKTYNLSEHSILQIDGELNNGKILNRPIICEKTDKSKYKLNPEDIQSIRVVE